MNSSMRRWLLRLGGVFGHARRDRELAAEIEAHLQAHVEDNMRAGMTPSAARRDALRRLGGVEVVKDAHRDRRTLPLVDHLLRDCRVGARVLRRSPVFTSVAVLTLALGIGANTAIYTIVDHTLLRPLPYPAADRLSTVSRHGDRDGLSGDSFGQTGATWFALRDGASDVDVAATNGGATGVNLVAGGQPFFVQQQRVTAGFFAVLGIAPALGREFSADEDRVNGPAAVVLSDAFWRRMFAGDPSAVGRSMILRGEAHTIVGIMPPGFQPAGVECGPGWRCHSRVDVWTPLRPSRTGEGAGGNYLILTRLKPAATWASAGTQIAAIGAELLKRVRLPAGVTIRMQLVPLQRERTTQTRQPLLILWGAVGAVLLIGCVNIAGLLLARASTRAPEIATRIALGGGRVAIVRQLLAESLLLSSAGGIAGLAIGYALLRVFALPLDDMLGLPMTLDGRVLAINAAVALATSIVFGIVPALQLARIDVRPMLGDGSGRSIAGAPSRWPRHAVILTQVALSVAIVFGAGLLVRTLRHLTQLEPGFDATNVITATLSMQDARYRTNDRINQLFDRTLQQIRSAPGIEHAAVALTLPYERALNDNFALAGSPTQNLINLTYVTTEYFDALRIPVRRGRVFAAADTRTSDPVIVVNQALVRRYVPNGDPIGLRIQLIGRPAPLRIIGVVGDIQQAAGWGDYGPVAAIPAAYIPAAQVSDADFALLHTWFSPTWIVRSTGPQQGLVQHLNHALATVDPQLPFNEFRTLDDVRAGALAMQRTQAVLLTTLSVLALVLAAIGIYGLVAGDIADRTRDLGIRMALGATPLETARSAMRPGVVLSAVGVAVGLALARSLATTMQGVVFGVSVADTLTLVSTGIVVLLVAWIAAAVPSLRILRMNVTRALRIN